MSDNLLNTPKAQTNHPIGRMEWGWAELIDFEFFLDQDQEDPPADLEERDRKIYNKLIGLEPVKGGRNPSGLDRRALFRHWLEARRAAWGKEIPLPGHMAMEAWRFGLRLLSLAGLVLGIGAAVQLMRYDGVQPVNVASLLGWLVLFQILLVLLAGGVFFLRQARRASAEGAWLNGVARWGWSGLALRMNRHVLDRVPGETRAKLRAFYGALGGKRSLYGRVLMWPLAGAWQRFGVAFNLAALVTTLALVLFSDRAFGWQSAMNISSEQIHALVGGLAAPWTWAMSSAAGPSLEQIEGSRIILKDGIKQLTTGHLVSWWPFLCMALFVYGFLPRLILWVALSIQSARSLKQLPFEHAVCDRLYARLTSVQFETAGVGAQPGRGDLPEEDIVPASIGADVSEDSPGSWPPVARGRVVVVVNDEIEGQLDAAALTRRMSAQVGGGVARIVAWPPESEAQARVLGAVAGARWEDGRAKIVLLEEGWQPPIAEKLAALRSWRKALGDSAALVLFLVGRPRGGEVLTPVTPSDLAVWQRQIAGLGDSHLRVEACA